MSALTPAEKTLSIEGKTIFVRELRASDGLKFLSKLSAYAGQLMSVAETRAITQEALASLIIGTSELSEFLVLKSTGGAVDPAVVSFSDFLEVLNAAIEVNLSEVTLKKGKAVADTVRGRLGMNQPKELEPMKSETLQAQSNS